MGTTCPPRRVIHPWWADGTKELIAVVDGVRESELSWKEVLLNLKSRGLEEAPELAIGDGALGFWKALRQVFPTTREQRCTVHKTANVLSKLPRSLQPQAKRLLHDISDSARPEAAVLPKPVSLLPRHAFFLPHRSAAFLACSSWPRVLPKAGENSEATPTSRTCCRESDSSTEKTNTRSKKRSCNVPQKTIQPKKPPPEPTTLKPNI